LHPSERSRTNVSASFETTDFFVDDTLFDDPYAYWDHVREHKGNVWIDERYNMAVVTGHDEEVVVLLDVVHVLIGHAQLVGRDLEVVQAVEAGRPERHPRLG